MPSSIKERFAQMLFEDPAQPVVKLWTMNGCGIWSDFCAFPAAVLAASLSLRPKYIDLLVSGKCSHGVEFSCTIDEATLNDRTIRCFIVNKL